MASSAPVHHLGGGRTCSWRVVVVLLDVIRAGRPWRWRCQFDGRSAVMVVVSRLGQTHLVEPSRKEWYAVARCGARCWRSLSQTDKSRSVQMIIVAAFT
jgi:hypothetical protein